MAVRAISQTPKPLAADAGTIAGHALQVYVNVDNNRIKLGQKAFSKTWLENNKNYCKVVCPA